MLQCLSKMDNGIKHHLPSMLVQKRFEEAFRVNPNSEMVKW